MTQESHLTKESHPSTGTRTERLGSYLTAVVGAGALTATSDAAIVNLDLSAFAGSNAGVASGGSRELVLSDLDGRLGGELYFINALPNSVEPSTADELWTGVWSETVGIAFATPLLGSPRNFGAGAYITDGISAYFSTSMNRFSLFRFEDRGEWEGVWTGGPIYSSPDFGPGSFLGFQCANGHYGWLEVTWDSTAQVFEILGGAFEDVAGVGIEAGAVAAVPEPAGALGTLGLLSAGMFLRRRQRAA